jgi:hypothetical protein
MHQNGAPALICRFSEREVVVAQPVGAKHRVIEERAEFDGGTLHRQNTQSAIR